MSGDGPGKLAPDVEPLDDIILGDDDDTVVAPAAAPPPVAAKPSSPPPPPEDRRSSRSPSRDRSSENRVKAADGKERKRSKLTLRIPDDEISRPTLPSSTPAGGVPAITAVVSPSRPPSAPDPDVTTSAPPLLGQPIVSVGAADDTLELPPDEVRARMAALTGEPAKSPVATGIDASSEPGWTPYQPEVEAPPQRPPSVAPPIGRNGGGTLLDPHEVHNSSPPPVSEEIPVEVEGIPSVPDPSTDDLATAPRLPVALDSEEIRIDDGDRVSDPADAPEVEPEDLVSVESIPTPAVKPPPPTIVNAPAAQAARVATPAAAAAAPAAPIAAVTPQAPQVAPAAVVAPVTPVATARRASSPGFFVPPVGALAPPPMTDLAATRKKTRPWWEELFNDDFIRTMAKVTDAQIAKEVSFIEESLGCEAGAMILDLACGTGRHAVELATRGYQVVGFDLSLAMLARASDEAQDRKQKINFVQGDMREMTFEETFDGVYAWNTSFGYFDEEKNAAVVAKVHKALKKGGQFLLDVVNRDYIVRQAPSLAWFEGDGCICMDEMTIDFITSRMRVKRTLMMDDGRTKEIEYSIRVYALHELGKMLHDNGFRVAEVSGRTGTPGVFFGCESPRTLILAEKR